MKVAIPQEPELSPEATIDNKLEILKFASQVQSRIKKDISEDFILAKLGDKDKEGITEMTSNAYFIKKLLTILKEKSTKYDWDSKKRCWIKRSLNETEKEFIQNVADTTFDSYLTRIFMTVILNRNVADNHLLKIITGGGDTSEDTEVDQLKGKISELMQPNEEAK